MLQASPDAMRRRIIGNFDRLSTLVLTLIVDDDVDDDIAIDRQRWHRGLQSQML